jgi:hypothetical protein
MSHHTKPSLEIFFHNNNIIIIFIFVTYYFYQTVLTNDVTDKYPELTWSFRVKNWVQEYFLI